MKNKISLVFKWYQKKKKKNFFNLLVIIYDDFGKLFGWKNCKSRYKIGKFNVRIVGSLKIIWFIDS
jgi:hypothetical protein